MYTLKRVQVTCPNCKFEFPYNKAALEKKIKYLGHRIDENKRKLSNLSNASSEKVKRIKKEIKEAEDLLSDYKLYRETLKQQEDTLVLENLKHIIKEKYGEEVRILLVDEALRRSAAYETSDMMSIGYYSHAGGKRVRKV